MTWARGSDVIGRLLDDAELERVEPSDDVAARLLHDAEPMSGSRRSASRTTLLARCN